jgi:hypothetical protein
MRDDAKSGCANAPALCRTETCVGGRFFCSDTSRNGNAVRVNGDCVQPFGGDAGYCEYGQHGDNVKEPAAASVSKTGGFPGGANLKYCLGQRLAPK